MTDVAALARPIGSAPSRSAAPHGAGEPTAADAAGTAPSGAKTGPFVAARKSGKAMNWLFADRSRMFWSLQLAGWLGFFLMNLLIVSALFTNTITDRAIAYSLSSTTIGFLTTSLVLRPAFRIARRRQPATLVAIALTAVVAMTLAMSLMKLIAFELVFGEAWREVRIAQMGTENLIMLALPEVPINLFLLGAWSGLYFGVNAYLNLRTETDRALRAARLADQAQLKMLRYQLNPHFLFNTLNAISTLVLVEEGARANEMLTKLSAFLRYSLDSDALQKTTLADEIRALDLYLDIETTRFGDRLTIRRDVAPETLDALVPSLILQPAIENAVKYAIARMESGGVIEIRAHREDDMLRLEVCDNGPDAPADPSSILSDPKGGVGLVNMRDRLFHLYGAGQAFRVTRRQGDGLCVALSIPFQTAERPS